MGRAGGKEAMNPAPDKRGSTSSKSSTGSGSVFHTAGSQACTLSRAYATEVGAALAVTIRRPLTAGTARKEGFCRGRAPVTSVRDPKFCSTF
ncbi:hypothetical protein IFM47457_08326 [Aspergillus lentulus]|uniref:Uncharacterized protein n=1 Tax=Aspergillus lentulus TaxID=293939 RepID=A0ABQ1AV82_ASPLE|nr:hypothetical protein CNMCM7927_007876 [Aspergillus lentulus]GFF67283.1 hypothetical protein IFM62136_06902 [Aspergillus lentulus]GFF88685.1 hypothetical protein IFM60648_08471 [Aspergillus lentulus]GFF89963.1 hypothetical protein IFM47457_08326 [Aspergillus lentulus]